MEKKNKMFSRNYTFFIDTVLAVWKNITDLTIKIIGILIVD